jgi:acyl-CoA reductase-like NAD-dependent aldehyde dehydrogenase
VADTPTAGAIAIPEADAKVRHNTLAEVDDAVAMVASNKDRWVRMPIDAKVQLLQQTITDTVAASDEWMAEAAAGKGLDPGDPRYAEELATGPLQIVRHARLLAETLKSLAATGQVGLPKAPYVRPDGQVVVPVFPTSKLDAATFVGHRAEVWMEPDVTVPTLRTATLYRDPPSEGKVCFILSAGNFTAGGVSDALHKLFVDGEVCVVKMNPVNEHLGRFMERSMTPFVREGVVRFVYGGVDVGEHLVDHPQVDTIHMTASDKTHDAVVFGVGDDGAKRKQANEPLRDRPVTSELGAVNPVIVVPGPWTEGDLDYHGRYLASMLSMNAGFTCLCPRVVVQHRAWEQRGALVDQIRRALAECPPRDPYYPGARQRWDVFLAAHPEAEAYGPAGPDDVPWTLIPDVDASNADDVVFRTEAFNSILSEVALDGAGLSDYLERSVEFCNDTLWGTLSATILVHPKTLKSPEGAAAVDRAVANLRYGTIGVNVWAGTGYGLGSTSWGAFPGHPLNDIQSGRGVVHNTYMLERPQKTVIHAPFKLGKKPPMAYDQRTFTTQIRRLLRVEAFGEWKQLPGIVKDGIKA